MNKTEEYIKNKLCKERVVKVRQIIKTIGENKVTTPLFILTFKLKKLPKTIKLGSEIKRVKPYQIRPSQCKKCYRFGHWFESCNRSEVCENCGIEGDHELSKCTLETKCVLCGGNHRATNQNCPKWKKQLEICEIRTEHQVGYRRAHEILMRKNSTGPNLTKVGASWGPSLVVSDSERVVYNNDYTKQATPYRQAIFLKPKTPRQIEKRPLRTSSPNTSMESIDIRNDNIIEQNLEKRRTGQSIKQTYYRSTRDRTKDRTIDTGRTFDTVGSSIFDTTNNEVEMDIQHAKPIEKERKKYYRNIKEKETAQTQPSKSSYRPITDSKKYKDSISECYDSESSITSKEKKHKYRTVIYREKSNMSKM